MNFDHIAAIFLCLSCPLIMLWGFIGTIRGNLAERNWAAVQKSKFFSWFSLGMSKETYIKQQRFTAWVALPFTILVMLIMVWAMIENPRDFSLKKMMAPKTSSSLVTSPKPAQVKLKP